MEYLEQQQPLIDTNSKNLTIRSIDSCIFNLSSDLSQSEEVAKGVSSFKFLAISISIEESEIFNMLYDKSDISLSVPDSKVSFKVSIFN